MLPPTLSEDALDELAQNQRFVALEPLGNARYQVRAAVPIPGEMPGDTAADGRRYLQAVFPIGYRQGRLADAVQDTYTRYSELRFLRDPLKDNLTAHAVARAAAVPAVGRHRRVLPGAAAGRAHRVAGRRHRGGRQG